MMSEQWRTLILASESASCSGPRCMHVSRDDILKMLTNDPDLATIHCGLW